MNITPAARALLVVALIASVSACSRREEEVGPAQKAGAAIDNAGDKVARELQENLEKADKAGQDIANAARATGDQIEDATRDATRDAGRGLDETTNKVGKKVERAGEKIQDAAR
ncbi:MAG: hypothetical protein ACXW2U_18665 [Telluria sp.]